MRSLYLRIYLTVVVVLAAFAVASAWLVQRHLTAERESFVQAAQERAAGWAELLQRSLPGADAPRDEQAAALVDWSQRLRVPLALDDEQGRRIGASPMFAQREADAPPMMRRALPIRLDDGRTLWLMRPGSRMGAGHGRMAGDGPPPLRPTAFAPWWPPSWLTGGVGLAALLLVLFVAVAAGAWPVVRRLTRRLEALQRGVEAFGAGALNRRVAEDGRDEVAALGASFNRAAGRIEALLNSHRHLLANASHELRSPLARLKMAVAMLDDAAPAQRLRLQQEIHANIAELDALVEEVLLASRLDASQAPPAEDRVDLLALAAEEAARYGAEIDGGPIELRGSEKLLRRALRNLLDNARRYGGDGLAVSLQRTRDGGVELAVSDRGPGVPAEWRERIFEPYCRLPGHAEREGGVGLGLSLVRQIAAAHGGSVRCEPRDGGGSRFVLALPAARVSSPA